MGIVPAEYPHVVPDERGLDVVDEGPVEGARVGPVRAGQVAAGRPPPSILFAQVATQLTVFPFAS